MYIHVLLVHLVFFFFFIHLCKMSQEFLARIVDTDITQLPPGLSLYALCYVQFVATVLPPVPLRGRE